MHLIFFYARSIERVKKFMLYLIKRNLIMQAKPFLWLGHSCPPPVHH